MDTDMLGDEVLYKLIPIEGSIAQNPIGFMFNDANFSRPAYKDIAKYNKTTNQITLEEYQEFIAPEIKGFEKRKMEEKQEYLQAFETGSNVTANENGERRMCLHNPTARSQTTGFLLRRSLLSAMRLAAIEYSMRANRIAANQGVANVNISQAAINAMNSAHGTSFTVDDLVITKGYADARYLTSTGSPGAAGQIRVRLSLIHI